MSLREAPGIDGVDQARRGWLEKAHVLNTLPWPQFHAWLQR
jgi:hypothetical protein